MKYCGHTAPYLDANGYCSSIDPVATAKAAAAAKKAAEEKAKATVAAKKAADAKAKAAAAAAAAAKKKTGDPDGDKGQSKMTEEEFIMLEDDKLLGKKGEKEFEEFEFEEFFN